MIGHPAQQFPVGDARGAEEHVLATDQVLGGENPVQIVSGVTGYTVETVEGAAFRTRQLLSNPELIGRMGAAGREHIRRNFLITRHLGDYLALLALLTR